MEAKFTIKNYRCFSADHPLQFTLRDGFTAFVGPNNSGKSFILKFFYELRNVWSQFRNEHELNTRLRATISPIDFTGVLDQQEVFHKFNNLPIEVQIEINEIKFCFNVNRRNQIDNVKIFLNNLPLLSDRLSISNGTMNYYSGTSEEVCNIRPLISLFEYLWRSIYIPSFRNAINAGADVNYFDIQVGSAFIDIWHNWKVGSFNWQNQLIQDITRDIKELFGYSKLEINAAPQLKTLQVVIDNKTYKLHEIGSGISQFILVFASAALRPQGKAPFILIDEPESNLHPALQQKFLTSLASYAVNGILFATHSIGLARSIADQIYSVNKIDNYSIVQPFEATANYAELLGELSFSTFRELGFSKLLLVEGPHDVRVFQQFLRRIHKDHEVVMMPLGGDSMINGKRECELGELKRICEKIYCWIDSEKDSLNCNLPTNREEFLLVCRKHKIKANASEKRAIENYFTENAVKRAVNQNCPALNEYEKLDPARHWNKEKNWRIAMEMDFNDIKGTDLGKFILSI